MSARAMAGKESRRSRVTVKVLGAGVGAVATGTAYDGSEFRAWGGHCKATYHWGVLVYRNNQLVDTVRGDLPPYGCFPARPAEWLDCYIDMVEAREGMPVAEGMGQVV